MFASCHSTIQIKLWVKISSFKCQRGWGSNHLHRMLINISECTAASTPIQPSCWRMSCHEPCAKKLVSPSPSTDHKWLSKGTTMTSCPRINQHRRTTRIRKKNQKHLRQTDRGIESTTTCCQREIKIEHRSRNQQFCFSFCQNKSHPKTSSARAACCFAQHMNDSMDGWSHCCMTAHVLLPHLHGHNMRQ